MRKLKTYITQSGFFELAVAAPSKKAAIEALGINANAFKHGFAKETRNAGAIASTTAKPGVVLRRPVGSQIQFAVYASLPNLKSIVTQENRKPAGPRTSRLSKIDAAKNQRRAARQQMQFEHSERMRKQSAAKLEKAENRHDTTMRRLNEERGKLMDQITAEEKRWLKEKTGLIKQ